MRGAIRDFFQPSYREANSLQHVRSSGPVRNRVQVTCNTSSAFHVQPAVCHLVRRDSSAIKFDRVGIAFILALLYWLEPLTDVAADNTTTLLISLYEKLLCSYHYTKNYSAHITKRKTTLLISLNETTLLISLDETRRNNPVHITRRKLLCSYH